MPSNSQHTTASVENYKNILHGKRGWIVTNGLAGQVIQCEGIMEALGLEFEYKTVSPPAPWRYLAPWGPTPPNTNIGGTTGPFAQPLPEVIIAASRQAVPYIRALTKLRCHKTLTIFLQDPGTSPKIADLIWISDHDSQKLKGDNVISTLLAPNRVTPARLLEARQSTSVDFSTLSRPCLAISIGGSNSVYKFNSESCQKFAEYLSKVAQNGASFLVTPSRRTDPQIIEAVARAIKGAPHHIWDGSGDNPYFAYLSQCDGLIVTADSVNMTGEAIATGKPVYVFHPDGGSAKFRRFHNSLKARDITRDFEGVFETWSYGPLNSTLEIAGEIATRWQRKQLSGHRG